MSRPVGGAHHDLERVQRMGARFLGTGLIGYLLVSLGNLIGTADLTAAWWPPLSAILAIGPGLALVIYSFRPGTAWLGHLAISASIGYLVACALWLAAWHGTTVTDPTSAPVWLASFPGMASMVLMLVYPRYGPGDLLATGRAAGQAGTAAGRPGSLGAQRTRAPRCRRRHRDGCR